MFLLFSFFVGETINRYFFQNGATLSFGFGLGPTLDFYRPLSNSVSIDWQVFRIGPGPGFAPTSRVPKFSTWEKRLDASKSNGRNQVSQRGEVPVRLSSVSIRVRTGLF